LEEFDEFVHADLRFSKNCYDAMLKDNEPVDHVYCLCATMGGMAFISGNYDGEITYDNALLNLNVAEAARRAGVGKMFYSSSACCYAETNQLDPNNPNCAEDSVYDGLPDSCYGVEKLFSEFMYKSYNKQYGLQVYIGRFHNIYGTHTKFDPLRSKFPHSICQKIATTPDGGEIEVWGKGDQTRSFLYVDECLDGIRRLVESDVVATPLNIGSDEMISINDMTKMVIDISGKKLTIKNVDGPEGVRGRNSDNNLIKEKLGWAPDFSLKKGMEILYNWTNKEANGNNL